MGSAFLRAFGASGFAFMICALTAGVAEEATFNATVLAGFWGFLDYYLVNG